MISELMNLHGIGVLLVALIIVNYILPAVLSPLRNVKGPTLARFSRCWEIFETWRGRLEQVTIDLHQRYGPVVRVAPNRFSLSDPSVIRTIYGIGSPFEKSDFYTVFGAPPTIAHKDIFSETSNAKHALERKKTSNMYAMSSLVSYEPFVDTVNLQFVKALAEHAWHDRAFDLFTWMQFYAFDVIGEITIGRSFGLIQAGHDKDGLLHAVHVGNVIYGSITGLIPEFHRWAFWLAVSLRFKNHWQTIQKVIQREVGAKVGSVTLGDRMDFVEKCIKLREAGKIDDATMNNVVGSNIGAGSDTTGISLTATIYYLMKHPECLQKLRSELDTATKAGALSDPVTFSEGQNLVYMQAVIKESLRMHPAVGQILSRVVPAGGAQLANTQFPAGTVVGVNPWVIHRDENIWGRDALEFNPERWLADRDKVAQMDQNFLAFGAGARTCIGKNISLLEMTKLLPQLVRKFEFIPVGKSDWTTNSGWFVKQSIQVKVRERAQESF